MRIVGCLSLVALFAACGPSTNSTPRPTGSTVDAGHDTGSAPVTTDGGVGDDTSAGDDAYDDDGGVDVFASAPPYVPQSTPPSLLTWKHLFKTGKVQTGLDCMECHDGTDGGAPLLSFGGTVYYDPGATQGAPGAEVRVVDATGVATTVYSDADGNFWQLGDPKAYRWPATTGVRNAKDAISMADTFKDAGCNKAACHDGSAGAARITVAGP